MTAASTVNAWLASIGYGHHRRQQARRDWEPPFIPLQRDDRRP